MAGSSVLFTAGGMMMALLVGGAAGQNFVEYNTYEFGNCEDGVLVSTTVYTGVPTMAGVELTDTCLEYEESTTTSFLDYADVVLDVVALQHVCNVTTGGEESGLLTTVWYSTDDCDEEMVATQNVVSTCDATCTDDEPDFGSDEFEEATITFYDTSTCDNATETEIYSGSDLYELYGVEDGTSCSPSGDFDFSTVIHCSNEAPVAVFYEDATCTGDIIGMTYNVGCAPVPSNGTYPGTYFMAECTEGVVEDDDEEEVEEEDDDVGDAANGAVSSLALGLSSGVAAASIFCAAFGLF